MTHFDVAAAAKLPEKEMRKLPKARILEIALYNRSRIERIIVNREERNVEIARLEAEIAKRDRDEAERLYDDARKKHSYMASSLARQKERT